MALRVIGSGSNLLVADEGVRGVVIRLDAASFHEVSITENRVLAGGGARLTELIQACSRQGLSGIECLVGIPGTVGGAVKINAGGRFGDIGSVCQAVHLMDTAAHTFARQRQDIYFGYRMTNILARFILQAELTLVPDDPDRIARLIREVWMLKKNSQPMNSRNAGCVFKNPRALSAGALIDKVGLKGRTVGGARVSDKHANFIEADDGCTAGDVLSLIDLIRERVRDRFEVELELEIEIWR
jgi:UDP-N-acetylmuramate dehydrogenase